MPRCDLLVWVLVVKLAPYYYRKLHRLLTDTGRYRELSSWRKSFKRTWRKLEQTPITLPLNDAYKPDLKRWVCTCPSFATSRFLVCKHLVQKVHRVPTIFFLEVKRERTTPFWRHHTLTSKALDGEVTRTSAVEMDNDDGAQWNEGSDEEFDEELVDTQWGEKGGETFEEVMNNHISTILQFAEGLRYQVQFRDERILQALEREGASFLRFARACMSKEGKRTVGRTWDKSLGSAMFYRTRPSISDRKKDSDTD